MKPKASKTTKLSKGFGVAAVFKAAFAPTTPKQVMRLNTSHKKVKR